MAVQDAWDCEWKELWVVPPDVVLALGDAVSGSCDGDFWTIWIKKAEAVLFSSYCGAGGPNCGWQLCLFEEEACYVFVVGVLEAELLEAEVLVGLKGLVRVMRLMSSLLNTLSTLLSKGIKMRGFTQTGWDALMR